MQEPYVLGQLTANNLIALGALLVALVVPVVTLAVDRGRRSFERQRAQEDRLQRRRELAYEQAGELALRLREGADDAAKATATKPATLAADDEIRMMRAKVAIHSSVEYRRVFNEMLAANARFWAAAVEWQGKRIPAMAKGQDLERMPDWLRVLEARSDLNAAVETVFEKARSELTE